MDTLKTEENNTLEKITTTEPMNGEVKTPEAPNESNSAVVAAHYNALEEKGLTERNKSRIVYLRNFNNWIKSMLINEYMALIKESRAVGLPIRVLDMCCGKGGDLLKWRNADIGHLVCADIAGTSVDQCRSRYEDMRQRQRRDRHHHQGFTAEFIVADCTKVRLRERYKDVTLQLDLVSCQFSFHYCFESLPQAECMLRNAAECLRPGGYFIGTMPDANDIVARYKAANSKSFGNPVYKIELESEDQPFPLFGAKYGFSLVDVVNCPEFLVHLPTLERLARKHGLELVSKSKFKEYFEVHKEKGRGLLGKMQAFETYPSFEGNPLNGEEDEYTHAKEFIEKEKCERVGTLSKPEWEAASLYMVFAFRKMKAVTMDREGRPVYEQQSQDQPSEKKETSHKWQAEELLSREDASPKMLKGDSTT
uniref:mRNA cap guanine-N(7) methyltransferase n=1 Tax=Graphocephala atropunctata TaxID=36148 RepID=A0A1B6MB57_9HEMI